MPFAALKGTAACLLVALTGATAIAQTTPPPAYDPALAASLGADERGMRSYVFVVLKTGPNKMPAGPERDEMFKGHFANMTRLATQGKLAAAGPFDGKEGWRGMFIYAVKTIEEAKQLTATDPVIINGEMVAEYHALYASAALMQVTDTHLRISKP
ncbi:YciI family protein [Caenimonas koreensis]|nr:YciI family protein [Caenimonas koreensis]